MERFWTFGRSGFGSYDFRQLIDTRVIAPFEESSLQIICDIDKTYLETNFSNTMQMIKIAFEDAKDKVTVPGASPFLMALRWGNPYQAEDTSQNEFPRPLHFVSASPPQLRKTLEEKITLDGLDWNSDSFKNQAYNIRKGQLGLLRHHVAYKSATLLSLIKESKKRGRFILIGDNAEFDAYVYLGLAFFLEGLLTAKEYTRYLLAGGVQDRVASDFEELLHDEVDARIVGILIRRAPGYQMADHNPFSEYFHLFNDYFETLCLMIHRGMIDPKVLIHITRNFHNEHNFNRTAIEESLRKLLQSDHINSNDKILIENVMRTFGFDFPFNMENQPTWPEFDLSNFPLKGDSLVAEAEQWAKKLTSTPE